MTLSCIQWDQIIGTHLKNNGINMENEKTQSGMSLSTVLFLIFLILKLTKTIDWSWWWVTSPLWLPIAFAIGFVIILGLISLITKLLFD